MDLDAFIKRWRTNAKGNERANKDSFIGELCAVLDVPPPPQKTGDRDQDTYVFEADILSVKEGGKTTVLKADLYKRGCFLLEAKQGSDVKGARVVRGTPGWNQMMDAALGQAKSYVRGLNDPPPFIVTCDIGYAFELYADFDHSRTYVPFPNAQKNRLYVSELARHLGTLRAIFLDPRSLDPSLAKIKVTRTVAEHIAQVAGYLEKDEHPPEAIAKFLMRCLFTMFAEDVDLLPNNLFTKAIEEVWSKSPTKFERGVENLWATMNTGGSFGAGDTILRFNGGLFTDPFALPLDPDGLKLLLEAAKCDWSDVEPAIFGTLLERALSAKERHKLGAHFTPRAYVERLVRPTIEEPVRTEWENARAAASKLQMDGNIEGAKKAVHAFHEKLCQIRVLDPACGTGNFLYVTLSIFKQIESEVLALLADLGEKQELLVRVTPKQFLGIEVKPWAKEIAELVLWIGYLQWHYRTHGKGVLPPEPVLQDFQNIECRDAVLTWDRVELVRDATGKPVTRWDGETHKRSPVTGEEVPDEAARVPLHEYLGPRKAEWPAASFIISNPPFLGNWRMRTELGDGYISALRATNAAVPDSADLVMYWWDQGARLVAEGRVRRAGFITTTSITQTLNRRIVEDRMAGDPAVSLAFAIADHPWTSAKYDQAKGNAEVRTAMTVIVPGVADGVRGTVVREEQVADGEVYTELQWRRGRLNANLTVGANVAACHPLLANHGISATGVKLHGAGFIVTSSQAALLGRGRVPGLERCILRYRNGQDIAARSRDVLVIDLDGLPIDDVRRRYPEVYQWVKERVKPERDHNSERYRRENWWLFGRRNTEMRAALSGLSRYIATIESARRRYFVFLDGDIRPDNMLVAIGLDDAFFLGVLSSRIHVVWALATGGRLGVRHDPRYNKTKCFEPFPCPDAGEAARARVQRLGEEIDRLRKRRQALHPTLTLTKLYKALDATRANHDLDAGDRRAWEEGLGTTLLSLHDDLDAAVSEAYGWPADLTDEQILEKLVALNAERAEEEKKGTIRWLRPGYQNPTGKKAATQAELLPVGEEAEEAPPPSQVKPWPKKLADQVVAVRALVAEPGKVFSLANVAAGFKGAKRKDVEGILDSIAALGLLTVFETAAGKRWRAAGKAAD